MSFPFDPGQQPPPPASYPQPYGGAPQQYHGWPPPGPGVPWPYPAQPGLIYPAPAPGPVSALPAYAAAALFVVCAVQSFVWAVVSWDGHGNPKALAAVIGIVYSGRITGNVDFGISMTMTVACTTLTLAMVLLARLAIARWLLAGLGGAVIAYYAVAVIYLVVNGATELVALPTLALLTWAAATTVALLPATARAMRRPTWRRA
ncbi:hypothetical protein [Dactylosporangium sp. CA-233914]|uniref:hypothetical protein n=1 Tax=Dactylosporangium sp. CA-233914 TaxID=3239934 RepID=UPI003D8F7231